MSVESKIEPYASTLEHSSISPAMDDIEIAKAATAAGAFVPLPTDELSAADKIIARRLLWKIDLWILPILTLVYLMSSMDRSDIGNAQIAGMQKALHVSNDMWPNIISLFYVGFIISFPFGNLLLRKLTPPVVIGSAVLIWGIPTVCLLAVTTYSQAVGLRVIIGVGEGLVHCSGLYLSIWYTPRELATRASIYGAASSLAGAFNGLIAYAIVTGLAHKPPFAPWQWIFLIEGVMAIGVGLIALFLLPPVPEKLRFGFTSDEKRLALRRTRQANNTPFATVQWKQAAKLFTRPMLYSWSILLSCNQVAIVSLSNFLPSVIKGMGYSSVRAQIMTVPVYVVGCVSILLFGYLSDKTQKRGIWIVLLSFISMLGYILLVAIPNNQAARYAGICLAAAGQYPTGVLVLTWSAVNLRGFTERAMATAVIGMAGQVIGLAGVQAFTTPPYYTKGNIMVLVLVALIPLLASWSVWYINAQNQRKRVAQSLPETDELRQKSFEELGSDHPEFFYQL